MPLPELTPGLIVRYEYLWARRAAVADTGDKDHPACVIATFRETGGDKDFVVYLPISHSPPSGDEIGVELSGPAKRAAGLDEGRQWVLVSECNVDIWPFDVRQIPREAGRFQLWAFAAEGVWRGSGQVFRVISGATSAPGGTRVNG